MIFLLISQVFKGEPVSKLCDVYSFGILLWEIVTYQLPFSDCLPFLVPGKVLEGEVSGHRPRNIEQPRIAQALNLFCRYIRCITTLTVAQ